MIGLGGRDGGSDEALTRAYLNEHGGAVLSYATKLTGDRATAEDVLQKTLERASRHPEVLVKGEKLVRAWLLTVAGRIVTDRAWQREVVESPDQPPIEPNQADQMIDSMDMVEALQKLPEEQREVIVQLYYRGCSLQGASEAVGVPEGTVKSRSYYALRALRKRFGGGPGVLSGVPA